MELYADLHIHSKFSRATAKSCDLEHLALWARKKGIAVVGTGDFTHPGWREQLVAGLQPAGGGLFRLHDDLQRKVDQSLPAACQGETRFMLSAEISTIYKKGERTRKVHHVLYAPSLDAADEIARALDKIGNITSDGRPILGLDSRDLLEIVLASDPGSYLVPAHIWTPWFSALGSKSGFDSIDECYGDLAGHIFAVETGLSSDPAMNWTVSSLDRFRLVSNSDAHSPPMLGREACIFDCALDYGALRGALETGSGYVGTVEFYPEEGKYHLDGHRNCNVRLAPEETRRLGGRCPECGKPVTVGVMSRVLDLADRPPNQPPPTAGEVRSFVPLCEILSELRGVGPKSKTVMKAYEVLLSELGPELHILGGAPLDDVKRVGTELLAEALRRLRNGEVIREAGYDGEYGVIRLFHADELAERSRARSLFEPAMPPAERHGTAAAAPTAGSPPKPSTRLDTEPPPVPEPRPSASERTLPLFGATPDDGTGQRAIDGLDSDQRAAAEVTTGPLLIVAGPGSGKTRTLTHRIAHLVEEHGVTPSGCLAITFTRRAAQELRERLQSLLPHSWTQVPVVTFHRLGLDIVREHAARLGLNEDFRVAEPLDRARLLTDSLGVTEARANQLLSKISRAKRSGHSEGEDLAAALATYQNRLRERGWIDFDDLVALPTQLLEGDAQIAARYRRQYPWLSIDEYQDVDALQYRLIRQLTPPDGNVCAIGDPDQAIYGFRGADVRFFLRFEEDFPGARVVRLSRNYRSGGQIVRASGQVVSASGDSAAQRGAAQSMEAVQRSFDHRIAIHEAITDRAEAEFIVHSMEQLIGGHSFFSMDSGRSDGVGPAELSFADFAVLYRTEAQADLLCEALDRSGMPYHHRSHDMLLDRPAVRELAEAVRQVQRSGPVLQRLKRAASALMQPSTEAHFETNAPASGGCSADLIGTAMDLLAPLAEQCGNDGERFAHELELGAQIDSWDPRADRIALLTLHAAKGLEFAVVFIAGCEDGILPLRFGELSEADVAEERRLLYVGMTRARERLLLCHARKRRWRGKVRPSTPSPFLRTIEEELLQRSVTRAAPQRPDDSSEQLDLF